MTLDPGSRNPHPLPTYGTYFRQDLRHPAGRRVSKAAGSREPAYLRVTRYRDLGDGRRHMATGMHGSEPAEDIVVDTLRSTRYHVSPSRGDCRDACAIRSVCNLTNKCEIKMVYNMPSRMANTIGQLFSYVTQENWFIPSNEGFKYT